MSKNIFFLTDNFPPEHNAAASRVYERGVYWVKKQNQLTVLTSFPNFPEGRVYDGYKNEWFKSESLSGIVIYRVKTLIAPNKKILMRVLDFLSYMVSSFFAGLFLIKKEHDVIIATSPQFFTAVSAWALSVLKRKPFIFELGDLWPESIKAVGVMKKNILLSSLEAFELFLYRRATVVVALTEAFKVNLVSRGIDPEKIYVVRNGVDSLTHSPKPRNKILEEQYKLTGKFVVGYIGTHGLAHDLFRAIDAAEKLAAIGSNVVFMFVGSGADKQNLQKYAASKKLQNVIFVDPQPKDQIGNYWGLLSLALVHLKNSTTFSSVIPSKLFESMAYGLPVLMVAPEGEAVDIVRENENGICLTDYDMNVFVNTLVELSQNAGKMKLLSENALSASKKYTRERQANLFLDIINKYC
jgi:glycosyltransferase involved in cell wall biosynthesis